MTSLYATKLKTDILNELRMHKGKRASEEEPSASPKTSCSGERVQQLESPEGFSRSGGALNEGDDGPMQLSDLNISHSRRKELQSMDHKKAVPTGSHVPKFGVQIEKAKVCA